MAGPSPDQIYARNAPFAVPGPWITQLNPQQQAQYNAWLKSIGRGPGSGFPDYSAPNSPYDMPRYWLEVASQGGNRTSVNPADQQLHFPDTYKTPYEPGFSAESKYATANNPFNWYGESLINQRTGQQVSGQPISTIPLYGRGDSLAKYQALMRQLQYQKMVNILGRYLRGSNGGY